MTPTADTITPSSALDEARISEAAAKAGAELVRVDTKAAMLLALAGAAIGGGAAIEATILTHAAVPQVAAWGAGAALLLVTAAVSKLLGAVQPNLAGGYGIVAYAGAASHTEAGRIVLAASPSYELFRTSQLVVGKYRRLGVAVRLLSLALSVAILTTGVTLAVAYSSAGGRP